MIHIFCRTSLVTIDDDPQCQYAIWGRTWGITGNVSPSMDGDLASHEEG